MGRVAELLANVRQHGSWPAIDYADDSRSLWHAGFHALDVTVGDAAVTVLLNRS